MNKIMIVVVLVLGILMPSVLQAQTARWAIDPQYTSITLYGENMYKVKKYGFTGILNKEGNVIVPVTADSITQMTEDCALVLKYEENKYRLTGILHMDQRVVVINDDWYVADFPFFSEGKLPVYNKTGKYGYIGTNGKLLIDFAYSNVHPFSEGWASVSKGKNLLGNIGFIRKNNKQKVFYIDEQGRVMNLPMDIGDIYSGTSFKNGEALVITKDNRYCFINTSGQLKRIDNSVILAFDEKYALQTEGDKDTEEKEIAVVYDGPTTFSENNLYGYKIGRKIILPPQFEEALPFSQGYAIASVKGAYGVLKLLKDDFSCLSLPGTLKVDDKELESFDYQVTVPEEWRDNTLDLICFVDGDEKNSCSRPGDMNAKRLFSLIVPKGKRTFCLKGDNLTVWNSSMSSSASTANAKDIAISISPSSSKANAKDNAVVVVRITNNTAAQVELSVEITGQQLKAVTKKIKLASGQTQKISTYFTNVVKEEYRSVTVSTSLTENAVSKRIKLLPFFVKY